MTNDPRLPWLRLVRAAMPHDHKLRIAARLAAGDLDALPAPAASDRADADLDCLDGIGGHLLTLGSAAYPARLATIARPPVALFVRGNPALLAAPQLAVVRSRRAGVAALETARDFAARLSAAGLVITSGLALGVDGAAHHGSLDAGAPGIGVSANGPERIYPAAHRELARRLLEAGGALVTEFAPGQPPRAHHFPQRNRIIAGLALGTLVVEAAPRSGSLITARYAVEQNREVFAMPGSIHNPLARGCHQLLRDGAKLVEQVDDILEELAFAANESPAGPVSAPASKPPPPGGDAGRVLAAVDHAPTDVDGVVRRTGLAVEAVSAALVELELLGWVCNSAGFFTRRGGPSP